MLINEVSQKLGLPVNLFIHEAQTLGVLKLPNTQGILLFTTELSSYSMPVPASFKSHEFIELYFLLPDYWEISSDDARFLWAASTLISIQQYIQKGSWTITGQTFSLKNLPEGRLKNAGFEALLLLDPIEIKGLKEVSLTQKIIRFKALCPIYKNEKDIKESRGIFKFLNRMMDKGMTEKVDEFRLPIIKSRFLFWK